MGLTAGMDYLFSDLCLGTITTSVLVCSNFGVTEFKVTPGHSTLPVHHHLLSFHLTHGTEILLVSTGKCYAETQLKKSYANFGLLFCMQMHSSSRAREVTVYCPFWIINKTNLPLKFKDTSANASQPAISAPGEGGLTQPLLFR